MAGAMPSGVLGALIALSNRVIYTPYLWPPQTSPDVVLVDQRLGGIIMWFSGPVFYGAITALIVQ